jgi:deazaflavin-dependent oxidoreductase (nitroreductase family)
MAATTPTDHSPDHSPDTTPGGSGSSTLSKQDQRLVRTMRRVGKLHRLVLRLSGNRIGARWFGGSDVVLLTVRGRTTGTLHTVPLMSLRDGDDLLVAASQGGVDREPQWWRNLQADPRAEAQVRGRRFAVTAEQVGDDERPQLWGRFVDAYTGFADYQAKVSRQIAVVRLRRVDPT